MTRSTKNINDANTLGMALLLMEKCYQSTPNRVLIGGSLVVWKYHLEVKRGNGETDFCGVCWLMISGTGIPVIDPEFDPTHSYFFFPLHFLCSSIVLYCFFSFYILLCHVKFVEYRKFNKNMSLIGAELSYNKQALH